MMKENVDMELAVGTPAWFWPVIVCTLAGFTGFVAGVIYAQIYLHHAGH